MIKFKPYVSDLINNSVFSKEYLAKRKKQLDAGDYNYKYNASVIKSIQDNNAKIAKDTGKELNKNGLQEWQVPAKPY
jgi:hypothetical protein